MTDTGHGDEWDLAEYSSTELASLIEQARAALPAALQREQEAANSAQEQLRSLASQLGGQLPQLRELAQATDETLTGEAQCRAIRTMATAVAQVTELARQSVLVGAQAAEMHH